MNLFEYATYDEGFILQVLGIFRLGMGGQLKSEEDELGPFTTLILGFWKLNLSISLEWRKNVNIEEGIW